MIAWLYLYSCDCLTVYGRIWALDSEIVLDLYIVFVRFNFTALVRQLSYTSLAFCSCYIYIY